MQRQQKISLYGIRNNRFFYEILNIIPLLSNIFLSSRSTWVVILVFGLAIFFALGLGDKKIAVYQANIEPVADVNGSLSIVFYGQRYEDYLNSKKLWVPKSGWQVRKGADSTILLSSAGAQPLKIYTDGQPVQLGLLAFPDGSAANVSNSHGSVANISLRSDTEVVFPLTIGGEGSVVPPSASIGKYGSTTERVLAFIVVFVTLMLTAMYQTKNGTKPRSIISNFETIYLATPLFVSSMIFFFAFAPANTAYDGSLQWVQAVTRGELFEPLGVTTTLFMRLFANFSSSPASLIVFQSSLSALATSLILNELRYRGVSFSGALVVVLALSTTPQYPSFFTNIGKDALSCVGLLYATWSLLVLFRKKVSDQYRCWRHLMVFIGSAVFASLMRVNVMPVMAIVVATVLIILEQHFGKKKTLAAGVCFIALLTVVPIASRYFSDEQIAVRKVGLRSDAIDTIAGGGPPLGLFSNLYIYHIFSAAVSSGSPLTDQDSELFYRIAPRDAWANYDCSMTDPTFVAVSKNILLTPKDYQGFLDVHQLDLAKAVVRIIISNPAVLFQRQACISSMLWYIGFGQKPFQATTALGYEAVDLRFPAIAGENRSLLPDPIREQLLEFRNWTESEDLFWLFWRPALIFYISFFIITLHLQKTRDLGIAVAAMIPVVSTLFLTLIIPFPAYRYQYPSVLVMILMSTLVFCRQNNPEQRHDISGKSKLC